MAEGLYKPKRSSHEKREMPFEASRRHEIWTSDIRYISHSLPGTGQAYVVSILDNYSRAILASAVTLSQDTNAYLSVLHAAIERYSDTLRGAATIAEPSPARRGAAGSLSQQRA